MSEPQSGMQLDNVPTGFALGLALQLAFGLVLWLLQFWMPVMLIGVAQLLWLGPFLVHLRRRQQFAAAKGVLILMGVTVLVNATCFGIVLGVDGFIH